MRINFETSTDVWRNSNIDTVFYYVYLMTRCMYALIYNAVVGYFTPRGKQITLAYYTLCCQCAELCEEK
jgi:hypothetical protein